MASFWDMARASKQLLMLFVVVSCSANVVQAQSSPSKLAAEVAELQFELARSLAQAGDHDAAAREFDRALVLQRQVNEATPEQTEAALQTLRAYVQSRPELPRIRDIERRLRAADRAASHAPVMAPNAAIGRPSAPAAEMPGIVPNAPPGAASSRTGRGAAPITPNPYRHPRTAWEQSRARRAAAEPTPSTSRLSGYQLRAPTTGRRPHAGPWWEQVTISADELLVPAEWVASLNGIRRGAWPTLTMVWSELLVPEGWEQPNNGGLASMLLVEAELLVPPGW